MKEIWIRLMVIMLCMAGVSCTKLDEEVYSSISSDDFFKTEDEVMKSVGRIYSHMRTITERYGAGSMDLVGTDECIIPFRETNLWWDNGVWIALHRHEYTDNLSPISGGWDFCFDGISMANQILYQLNESSVQFATKDNIVAEVKIARAFFYYRAIDWFGNIPITTDFTDVSLPRQSTRKEAFEFLIKEIKDNLPLLADEPSSSSYGRTSTKAVANMILAKAYMSAKAWINEDHWDDALTAINKVIATPGYDLESDYFTNFKTNNEGSKENIFVIPYDRIQTTNSNMLIHCWTLHSLSAQTFGFSAYTWDGYATLEDFYNAYDLSDSRINSWLEGPQYSASGQPLMLNPSRQLTYRPHIKALFNTADPALLDDGVRFQKYEYEPELSGYQSMSNDWVVFRYADALLMKSEVLIRKNGNVATQEAVDLANRVRERAFGNGGHNYTTATLTLDELLTERGREFAWEFLRRQDLIRFGKWNDAWFEKAAHASYKELYPIPYQKLDVNPNLHQNTGY